MSANSNPPPATEAIAQLRTARTNMRVRIRYAANPDDRETYRYWLTRIQQALDAEERELIAHDRMS